jgi:hypothetical protein
MWGKLKNFGAKLGVTLAKDVREFTPGGVPLEKAKKVDEELKKKLLLLEEQLTKEEDSEANGLRTALEWTNEKAAAIRQIQRELASFGEHLAAQDRFVKKVLQFRRVVESSINLWKKDWADTKRHWEFIKQQKASKDDIAKVKAYIKKQKEELQELIKNLALIVDTISVAESHQYGGKVPVIKAQGKSKENEKTNILNAIQEAKELLLHLETMLKNNNFDYSKIEQLNKFWADLNKEITGWESDPVSLLNEEMHKSTIEKYKHALEKEIEALLMVLHYLYKQQDSFSEMGIKIMRSSKISNIRRSGAMLRRVLPIK